MQEIIDGVKYLKDLIVCNSGIFEFQLIFV